MMRATSKLAVLAAALLLALLPAQATQLNPEEPSTGTVAAYCSLSFAVTDEAGTYEGPIEVTLRDIATGRTYDYQLTYRNGWGNGQAHPILANTTYEVEVALDEGYALMNTDGSDIAPFGATESGHTLRWTVLTEAEPVAAGEAGPGVQTAAPGNEEAEEVFAAFLDAVSGMEEDPGWNNYFRKFEIYETMNAQSYMDQIGGSVEDWQALDLFRRFLYYESYIRIAEYTSMGDYDRYFSSWDNFYAHALSANYQFMKQCGEAEAEAYLTLMEWQYAYIQEHGAPYNFIDGISYLQMRGSSPPGGMTKDPEVAEPAEGEAIDEALLEEAEEETGLWSGVAQALRRNLLGIVLVVMLSAGLAGVHVFRKSRSITDEEG